jgi:hypothetical protein
VMEVQKQKNSDTLKNNSKLRIFLVFLTLSFFFWMIIKLSEEYIYDVRFNIEYTDYPPKLLLQKEASDEIILTLKTVGFKLLRYRIKEKKIKFSLANIEKKNKHTYYSNTRSNFKFIQSQFSAETELLNIKPDTLFFEFGKKFSKKVKITSQVEIEFRPGFNIVDDLEIEPKEVSISGPDGVLDSILTIMTKELKLSDISESFEKTVSLVVPKNITVSPAEVVFKAKVDKFTQGTFALPFEVINVPKSVLITTFPKEVKVIYTVPFSDYNKIVPESFKVICDYKETKENELDYLHPRLIDKPKKASSVRIVPNKIDYLIKK